jgi:hypothetical protein
MHHLASSHLGIRTSNLVTQLFKEDLQAHTKFKRELQLMKADPSKAFATEYRQYVYRLNPGTTLPSGIHITRDDPWLSNTSNPTGHHSLNSTIDGLGYDQFIKRISSVAFEEEWYVELRYTCTKVNDGEEWLIRRTGIYRDGSGEIAKWATVFYV